MNRCLAVVVAVLFLLSLPAARSADQWWDTGVASGLQGGTANWSTSDSAWSSSSAGTTLGPWTNGNSAFFQADNSTCIIGGTVTANVVTVIGGPSYTTPAYTFTNGTLALGPGGMTNTYKDAMSVYSSIKLLADQTWTFATDSGRTHNFFGSIGEEAGSPAGLTLFADFDGTVVTTIFTGTNTFSGGLTVRRGSLLGYAQDSGSPFGASGNNITLGYPRTAAAQLQYWNTANNHTSTVGTVTINEARTYFGVVGSAGTTGTLAAATLVRNGRGTLTVVSADPVRGKVTFTGGEAINNNGMLPAWITKYTSFDPAYDSSPDFMANTSTGLITVAYDATAFDYARANEVANLGATVTAMANNNTSYAVRVQASSLNISNFTLTIGDGVRPAGLILAAAAASSITGDLASALDFRGSEGVIFSHNTKASSLYTTVKGTNGLTISKSGTSTMTVVTPQESLWSGPTTILGEGTLVLKLSGNPIYSDTISGLGGLTKDGTGTLTLTGMSNNLAGALTVTGGGALSIKGNQTHGGTVTAGAANNDARNQLAVINGATLASSGLLSIGSSPGADLNTLTVTNAAQIYSIGGRIGSQSSSNTARIANSTWNLGGGAFYIGYGNTANGATGNTMIVDNAVITNAVKTQWEQAGLAVGYGGSPYWTVGNSLLVTNGARIYTAYSTGNPGNYSGSIGDGYSISNRMTMAGNTYWDLGGGDLSVGSANQATGNVLTIDGMGIVGSTVVTNVRQCAFNNAGGAFGNQVNILNGARLYSNSRLDFYGQGGSVLLSGNALWWVGSGTYFYIGGTNNALRVEDGSQLVINNAPYIWTTTGGTNDLFLITGSNSICRNNYATFYAGGGYSSTASVSDNWLRVENGGVFTNTGVLAFVHAPNCRNNMLSITNGGRVFTAGSSSLASGTNCMGNTILVRDANSLLDAGNAALSIGSGNTSGFNRVWVDGGSIARIGFTLGSGIGAFSNSVILTNGALVSGGADSTIGGGARATGNVVLVTGNGSIWNAGTKNITVGAVSSSGNSLTLDQGGTVDNIGTLTLAGTNQLNLLGGTLGAAYVTLTTVPRPAIAVGDGTQAATLKALGGNLLFTNGLLVASNGTLSGIGYVSGGTFGINLTNGAAVNPGLAAPGLLTTSNLNWFGGATFACALSDFKSAPGTGWGLLNVSTQLALLPDDAGNNYIIRLDSLGSNAANFNPGQDYNLRIVSAGLVSGFNPAKFTIATNALWTDSAGTGTWNVTNVSSTLYVIYRAGLPAPAGGYVWDPAQVGLWSTAANWQGGVAPMAGGDPTNTLEFPGGATAYVATNNQTNAVGLCLLNKLYLTSGTAPTNILAGGGLQFTGSGAEVRKTGPSDYVISNRVDVAADLRLWGSDIALGTVTLASNITGSGSICKEGNWNLVLKGSNSMTGTILLDSADGMLRGDHIYALGASSFIVSNGLLASSVTSIFSGATLRTALVTGSGSVWSNASTLTIGTNAAATIANSATLRSISGVTVADRGTVPFGLTLSNAALYGGATIGGAGVSSSRALITGPSTYWNGTLSVGTGGNSSGNVVRIDNGALLTNITCGVGAAAGAGLPSYDNRMILTGGAHYYGLGNNQNHLVGYGFGADIARNVLLVTTNAVMELAGSPLRLGMANTGNNVPLSHDNQIVVSDGGMVWRGSPQISGVGNSIVITNGGRMFAGSYDPAVGGAAGGTSNLLLVTGAGALFDNYTTENNPLAFGCYGGTANVMRVEYGGVVTNLAPLVVGNNLDTVMSAGNGVIVTNGGRMYSKAGSGAGTIGGDPVSATRLSSNNFVVVSGPGSLWDGGAQDHLIGYGAVAYGNGLSVLDAGVVTNMGILYIGRTAAALNNALTVSNGVLAATGVVFTNALPNSLAINGASTVSLSSLFSTNVNGTIAFNGGTLNLQNAFVSNGVALVAGDGTQSATLNLQPGNGTCLFANGLVITNAAALAGSGVLQASTTTVFGALCPGPVIGAITNSGAFTLTPGASARFKLAASTAPGSGWDFLSVNGNTLTLGGTLQVYLSGVFVPASSNSFVIMTNTVPLSDSGAWNGTRVSALRQDTGKWAGTFKVTVGTQNVVLSDFSSRSPGSLLYFR
jgi:autotransporter-associated beta strand protein